MTDLFLNATVLTTWGIMTFLGLVSWIVTRKENLLPSSWQAALEGLVVTIEDAIAEVTPEHAQRLMPFVGTLWIFLAVANLVGIIPGLDGPTSNLSTTTALAILVFLSVHWFGIRIHGLRRYLKHYLEPNPIMLPFHIISEISRTVALAVRLFGNIFSLQTAAVLVLLVAGFLVPIPLLLLHIIEALVQAYIFGMLALIYIAGGVESMVPRSQEGK